MAASVVRTPEWVTEQGSATNPDLPGAVDQMSRITPDRVVVRYRDRVLNYRDLKAALNLMMPVTRSQQMDDHSAVVAAIFAGLPALGSEFNAGVVAAVVDGAMQRIVGDMNGLPVDAPPVRKANAAGTSEIDLRVVARRLSGA